MTIRDIAVAFGFEVDKSSEKEVQNSIKGVKNLATKLLGSIAVVFSIRGMMDLAQAAADAEALKSQFSQVFDDMEEEAASKLDKISQDTGVAVNRMKNSFTQIAAFSKTTGVDQAESLDIANRAMIAIADSAAFYDRSIEEVTESMRSFLKGNYENDAALGLSATETTRNAAANELYGKSFMQLSEAQKQFTLLKMVEDANKLSGALGQAQRESDTWTNQLGNLKQAIVDLKAAGGSTFLKPAVSVLKLLTALVQRATKAVNALTGENGLLTKATERYHALIKRLQPAIERMTQALSRGLNKGISTAKGVVDRLGGIENVMRMLSVAAAAFLLVMNWSKIISGAKAFAAVLSTLVKIIPKLFSLANLKIMGIIALVALLLLAVEDFVSFLQGKDSVIGTIFDRLGIGTEKARQAVFDAFTRIKNFLLGVWDTLKTAAGMFADTVGEFFERNGESIRSGFERVWGIISSFLFGVWTFISQAAATIFGGTEDTIGGSTGKVRDTVLSVWQAILQVLLTVFDTMYGAASTVFGALLTVIEVLFKWIQSFWNAWGSEVLAWFKALWDSVGTILLGFLDVVSGIANFISSVFTGDWRGAWEAVKQIFSGVWSAIVGVLTAVWETIKLILTVGLGSIKAGWETSWNAIVSFFTNVWSGVTAFLSGVWNTITSTVSTALSAIWGTISSVFSSISSFVTGVWSNIQSFISTTLSSIWSNAVTTFSNILSSITTSVSGIKDAVVNGFNSAIDFIKSLPAQALQWGKDFIGGLKDGILSGISGITDAVKGVGNKIKSFLHFSVPDEGPLTDYESWMPDFMNGLARGINASKGAVTNAIKALSGEIQTAMAGTVTDLQTVWNSLPDSVQNTITATVSAATSAFSGFGSAVSAIKTALSSVQSAFSVSWSSITSSAAGAWRLISDTAATTLSSMLGNATSVFGAIRSVFSSIWDGIVGHVGQALASIAANAGSAFSNILSSITASVSGIKSSVVAGFEAAISYIKSLPGQAVKWGADFIDGLRNGILSGVHGIVSAVKNVGNTIRSYLHFSVPDKGPLRDYESWMPDFLHGMAKGISDNESAVLDKVRYLADGIKVLVAGATATAATARSSAVTNNTSSIVQNVNIDNTYNGGSAETQKNVSKAMKRSAVDATTQMARGLAYARG